jgi:hypothetical protein
MRREQDRSHNSWTPIVIMFETDLKNLASLIITEAIKSTTPFEQRVDALKAGTTLYGLLLKHKELDDPADAGHGPSFLDFSEAVAPCHRGKEEQPNGGAREKVRTGTRGGPR